MSIGASIMVLFGIVSVKETYSSINLRVIVFLFSMLAFAANLEISGVIEVFAVSSDFNTVFSYIALIETSSSKSLMLLIKRSSIHF